MLSSLESGSKEAGNGWIHVDESDTSDGIGMETDCCTFGGRVVFDALLPFVQKEAVASAVKIELHSILNAFQSSPRFGVHVCESFKDPRKHAMDDYWGEVELEAFSIEDLHHVVGGAQRQPSELSDESRARLHQFARALERLSRRIDRVVLAR